MEVLEKVVTPTPACPSSGSSSVGHHFVQAYRDCPRRWFLRYELGIESRFTKRALTFGLAWHKAIETFYTQSDLEPLKVGRELLEAAGSKYEYSEDFETDHERIEPMLKTWIESVGGPVLAEYEVLSLEETMTVELPNGMVYTGRSDEIVRSKDRGVVLICEHKSTTFSLGEMERTVFLGDQLPSYMVLFKSSHPELADQLAGALLDVTYMRGSKIQSRASGLYFDESDCARLVLNVTGQLTELSQKLSAVREGVSDALLFPRNGAACSRFKCEYEPVCRRFIDRTSDLPDSLVRLPVSTYNPLEDIGE